MDKLDKHLKAHFKSEIYTCTDRFIDAVEHGTTPTKRRVRFRTVALAATLCILLTLGAAAGGLRVFLPGKGFTDDDGFKYYTADMQRIGECLIDSAIAADGRLTVWLYNDYNKTSAPERLTLITDELELTADAEGFNPNISPGYGFSVFTFELGENIPTELTLSDGSSSARLTLGESTPETSFTLTASGYTLTLSQLTENSRLLMTEVKIDKLDPIAAEADELAFKPASHGIFEGEPVSLAYTEDAQYAIQASSYGIKHHSPEGLAEMEERNAECDTNFRPGQSYMAAELENIEKRGHSDELTIGSRVTRIELERLSIVARSSAVGYPMQSEHWEGVAFDTSRITVPAVGSDKLTFAEPVILRIGEQFALQLTAIERVESRWGDEILIDFEVETDSSELDGIEIDSVGLHIPGWDALFTLERGRICLKAGDKLESVETSTVEANLPVALFELAYSLPIG